MGKPYFDTIDLQDNLEISNAISAALGLPVAELIGRKFYFNSATLTIYLFENGRYRPIATLPAQPAPPDGGYIPGELNVTEELKRLIAAAFQVPKAAAPLLRGEVVRVGNGYAYPTDYTDQLAATWKLAVANKHADTDEDVEVQTLGGFSDVAYSLLPGRIWLGAPGARYGVQTPPPMLPGVVQAVLGTTAGGADFFINPDAQSIFIGASL